MKEKENTALRFVVANAELNNSKRVELIVESAKKHVTTLGRTQTWNLRKRRKHLPVDLANTGQECHHVIWVDVEHNFSGC